MLSMAVMTVFVGLIPNTLSYEKGGYGVLYLVHQDDFCYLKYYIT